MQKHVVNHSWKFSNPKLAFLIGFIQMAMVYTVETINIVVLLSNYSVLDVLLNFLALCVIADFDEMFVMTLSRDRCYQHISN